MTWACPLSIRLRLSLVQVRIKNEATAYPRRASHIPRMRQEQQLASYRRALAKVQAQVKLLRDRRAQLRNLRSQLANTVSSSRLLLALCQDRPSASGLAAGAGSLGKTQPRPRKALLY